MYLCLFEDDQVNHFLPLVYTRAVYDLRLGMRTLLQTTRDAFGQPATLLHARPLVASVTAQENDLLVNRIPEGLGVLFVNGRYVAERGDLLERIRALPDGKGRVLIQDDAVVAAWVPDASSLLVETQALTRATFDGLPEETVEGATFVGRLWDLLEAMPAALVRDYHARVQYKVYERPGATVYDGATLLNGEDVFLAPGATVYPGAILNAEGGPIYLAESAVVMENAVVRGPAYLGPHGQINVAASIEDCALGPWCKIGGEVHGSVFHSFSNKGHAGYVGDSYIGRWCNIGADTNTSNLKNNYGSVSLYNHVVGDFEDSGQQFLGTIMGDHTKSGINTMLNTGTVIGVSANVYGADFPPRLIPSFSWGGAGGLVEFRLDKALEVAEKMMARRNRTLTEADRENLEAVFALTAAQRAS